MINGQGMMMQSKGFYLKDGELGGPRFVPTRPWTDAMTEYLIHNHIKELHLNYTTGWSAKDVKFLGTIPHLQGIHMVMTGIKACRLDALNRLHELVYVRFVSGPRQEDTIDFTNFPKLEECALTWNGKVKSVLQCVSLRRLSLWRYKASDCTRLAELQNLERLKIVSSPLISVTGVANLQRLKHLIVAHMRKLGSLADIDKSRSLEKLETESCRKINSLEELVNAPNLKEAWIDVAELSTLEPLTRSRSLEQVGVNSKVTDGDMSVLLKVPKLKIAFFRSFRHYTHHDEVIRALLQTKRDSATGSPRFDA